MPANKKRSYVAIAILALAFAGSRPPPPTATPRAGPPPTAPPTPRKPTAAEKETMRRATVQSSDAGMPDPHADAEARKLHPDDWKPAKPAN